MGLGAFGFIMMAAFSIFGTGVELSNFHIRSHNMSENMSDALTQLSSIMPNVVKINACRCAGTAGTYTDCAWSEASPWSDPVISAGVPNGSVIPRGIAGYPAVTGLPIFDAEFEAFQGADVSGAGPGDLNDTASIAALSGYTCGSHPYTSGITSKGCRQRVRLYYTAPTLESGATTSLPGQLQVVISQSGTADNAPYSVQTISLATRNAKAGLVGLSCGLVTSGTQVGMTFALNLRMKIKLSSVESTTSARYESWNPSGHFYNQGIFRETKLKFSFPNLYARGAYQWRTVGMKNCIPNGTAPPAASNRKDECCSGAWDGTTCVACVASGAAGTNNSCCSDNATAGVCD